MRALGSEYLRSCFALKGIHNNSILLCSQILVWTSKLRYYLQSVHFYSGLWLIQEEHSPQHLYVHLVTHRKWTFKLVRIRHWQKNADLVVVLHIFDRCSDLVSLSIFITEVFLHEKLFFFQFAFWVVGRRPSKDWYTNHWDLVSRTFYIYFKHIWIKFF